MLKTRGLHSENNFFFRESQIRKMHDKVDGIFFWKVIAFQQCTNLHFIPRNMKRKFLRMKLFYDIKIVFGLRRMIIFLFYLNYTHPDGCLKPWQDNEKFLLAFL